MAQRPECCWPPPRSYSPDLGPSQRGAKPTRLVFTPRVHHLTIDAGPTPGGRPYAVRFECPASKVTTGPDGRDHHHPPPVLHAMFIGTMGGVGRDAAGGRLG